MDKSSRFKLSTSSDGYSSADFGCVSSNDPFYFRGYPAVDTMNKRTTGLLITSSNGEIEQSGHDPISELGAEARTQLPPRVSFRCRPHAASAEASP